MKFRPVAIVAMSVLLQVCSLGSAQSSDFPQKPVRIIVPFAPGNGVDVMARALADGLSRTWSQQVYVENRPGASGIVAMAEVKKSPADGYTYFAGDVGSVAVNPSLYRKLNYDPQKDLAPITDVMAAPWVFFVSKRSGIKTLNEFISLAKQSPGKLTYASTGLGAPNFMAAETFKIAFGIDLKHIPYRDSNQLHNAAASNEVNLMISSWATARSVVDQLVPLAVAASERQPSYPDVPTVEEATGKKDFELNAWAMLFGVVGTPQAILEKVARDATGIIKNPEYKDRADKIGIVVIGKTPQQVQGLISSEIDRYRAVIEATGAKRD